MAEPPPRDLPRSPPAPRPRDELRDLPPALHGGAAPDGALDFSTGVSPLPAPARILDAVRAADLSRYPEPTAAPLRRRLAALHEAHADEVVAGAGSVELIWTLARAFAGPGRRGAVFAPAFGEYAQALRASGAAVVELRSSAPPWPLADAPLDGIAIAFLCRPGNPTLALPPPDEIAQRAAAWPHTLFVVDEAYLPMFDGALPVERAPNVVVLRSMTKLFALPGLRLGYLVAAPDVARAVKAALPPWNVSAPAHAAGLAAVDALDELPAIRRELARLRGRLVEALGSRGLVAQGGPFTVWDVGDAARLAARLDGAGVRVRDCSSFGLPAHVRLGVRPAPEIARLAAAWSELR